MKEVLISGTKLKVVSYDVIPVNGSFNLPNKKNMAYQFLVGYSGTDKDSLRRYDTTCKKSIVLKGSTSLLALEKTKTTNLPQNYTEEDLSLILFMLSGMPVQFLEPLEALVISTKDKDLINLFRASYGNEGILRFKDECFKKAVDRTWTPNEDVTMTKYPMAYKRGRRYSVYSLLKDLCKDQARILTDPELVGTYERISASKTVKPGEVSYVPDQWQCVSGIIGNKTRANLSIQFTSFVDVEVPENDLGIKAGVRRNLECIKTMTVIKDGILHTRMMAVMVSSKLAHRLKAVGCVKMNLIYKNCLLLDLGTIPVICRYDIKKFTSEDLASVELDKWISGIAIDYLNLKKSLSYVRPKTKLSKTKASPQELFLKSLGIFENKYYPQKEVHVREGRSYFTTELITSLDNLPKDPASEFLAIKEFVSSGSITRKSLKSVSVRENLEWILKNIESRGLDIDGWRRIERYATATLRDMKFQMIMSKVAKFKEKDNPYIGGRVMKLSLFNDPKREVSVSWKFKDTKINV